eukprot:GHUV01047069.1.p1 GENE.GHUV01047069.1~~GHUV01047069.1.p1  ORF type:complete len:182 (+),score=21.74 GHUV01047069.1:81-548(+)
MAQSLLQSLRYDCCTYALCSTCTTNLEHLRSIHVTKLQPGCWSSKAALTGSCSVVLIFATNDSPQPPPAQHPPSCRQPQPSDVTPAHRATHIQLQAPASCADTASYKAHCVVNAALQQYRTPQWLLKGQVQLGSNVNCVLMHRTVKGCFEGPYGS